MIALFKALTTYLGALEKVHTQIYFKGIRLDVESLLQTWSHQDHHLQLPKLPTFYLSNLLLVKPEILLQWIRNEAYVLFSNSSRFLRILPLEMKNIDAFHGENTKLTVTTTMVVVAVKMIWP